MSEDVSSQWDGDVLQRKQIADFLYRLISRKYEVSKSRPDAGSICFALDGPWGSGKSFFVSKWAKDFENCQHPIMFFDAWKNDLSEEPLMGFIAALQDALGEWAKQVPVAQAVKDQANRIRRDLLRK